MGLLDTFKGFFDKTPDKFQKFDQYSPEQNQLLQQIMQMVGGEGQLGGAYGDSISQLQQYLDPSSAAYQQFAAPEMQQFEQETVPGLGERFAGAGAMGGGLSSSGFGQALSSAGGQLQTRLGGMKAGLQQQAMQDIMNQYGGMSKQGMGAQPFGYSYQPGSPSGFQSMMQAGAQGAGGAMGGAAMGGAMGGMFRGLANSPFFGGGGGNRR